MQRAEQLAEPPSEESQVMQERELQSERRLAQFMVAVSKRKPISRQHNRRNNRARLHSSNNWTRSAERFQPA